MDFEAYQTKFKSRINQELDRFFDKVLRNFVSSSIEYEFTQVLREYTMRGGKRTRPALLYNFYLLLTSKENSDEVISFSIFFELLQSSLLIHDDIIDRDNLRRNGKTVHKIYEDLSNTFSIKNSEHFGNSIAILVGDYATQLAYQIIVNANLNEVSRLKIIDLITKLTGQIIHGHLYDVAFSQKVDIPLDEIVKTYKSKTVKYAFELPVLTASAMTNQKSSVVEILKEYSYFAGMAFQMREDIITFFGNTQTTGKSDFSDIKEGKRTVLYFEAMAASSIDQKKLLRNYYGNSETNSTQAETIQKIFKDTGAYESVKNQVNSSVCNALDLLEKLSVNKSNLGFQFIFEFTKRLFLE